MAEARPLADILKDYYKLKRTEDIFYAAEQVVNGFHRGVFRIKRGIKRVPIVKPVVGSRIGRRAINTALKGAGPAAIFLSLADTQCIRSVTKGDIPTIVGNIVDAVQYLPEFTSYVYNNPTEFVNEAFGEGLVIGIGESLIILDENASPNGYINGSWIADSEGGHIVSFVDENGNPKTTVEKQEYIYQYIPNSDNQNLGRLIVYRPSEGLTDQVDENNERIREILRVPVAEFNIVNGRVTQEIERQNDGTILRHNYDDSNPTYTCLDPSRWTTHWDKYTPTNEIFARYGMPEIKTGFSGNNTLIDVVNNQLVRTATDVLNTIKIGKRVSTEVVYPQMMSSVIVNWDESQDFQIVFTDRHETTYTTSSYRPQSLDEIVCNKTTVVQSSHCISYRELQRMGIDISGDKNDPEVRDRITKDLAEKMLLIKNSPYCETITPPEQNTTQQYRYIQNTPYTEYTTGYANFFKNHPLFGQREGIYINKVIDYDSNVINYFDSKGNLLMVATYDTPNEYNHYQYAANNVFIPTDTEGVRLQFSPSGNFLGFSSGELMAQSIAIKELEIKQALLQDFIQLKKYFQYITGSDREPSLSEIKAELEKLPDDNSDFLNVITMIEGTHFKTCNIHELNEQLKQIDEELNPLLESYNKQIDELEKQYIQRDNEGNITISTKLHPNIQCQEIIETDEYGVEQKIIKANGFTNLTMNMMDYVFVQKNHNNFPVTEDSKNEFFTKSIQEDNFNYYRINYNGTPETQNYGGYVQEDTTTGICYVFNHKGNCIHIDIPNREVKDDENWATNPESDKYQRIQEIIIESARGGISSNAELLNRIDEHHRKGFPKEYENLLSEYKNFVQKPFEFPDTPGKYADYNYYLPEQCEITKGVMTAEYIAKQNEYLTKMEDMLNGVENPSPEIEAEKQALSQQRHILQEMQNKPENERITYVIEQARLTDRQIQRVGTSIPKNVSTININNYISESDKNLSEPISVCANQNNPSQIVYRVNNANNRCTGLIIEDKKTGVCQVYDCQGLLIEVDRPMNTAIEEDDWYRTYLGSCTKRYKDMYDMVCNRYKYYQYNVHPELVDRSELLENENRHIHQQRLAEHENYIQMNEDIGNLTETPLLNNEFPIVVDLTEELQHIHTEPRTTPLSENNNQAVATNNQSGLQSSLRNAQENNSIQIDAERVEEQINNSNQTAVASQSR